MIRIAEPSERDYIEQSLKGVTDAEDPETTKVVLALVAQEIRWRLDKLDLFRDEAGLLPRARLRARAGLGTAHRGEGECWKHEGLDAPLRHRSAKPAERPAFSLSPPSVDRQLRVLDTVLASCARQQLKFEEAWRIAAPVALHGVEHDLAERLRRELAAEPFRARVADGYERRVRRSASREGALLRQS